PRALPRHRRAAREHRPREPQDRRGGPQAAHGLAPAGPWRRDVAARPPARRRRGQIARRRHGPDPLGQARDGPEDAKEPADRPLRDGAAAQEEGEMSRSVKKGPYVEASLKEKIEMLNSKNEKKVVKTWSRPSVVIPAMVGHTIAVHAGHSDVRVLLTGELIGDCAVESERIRL